MLPPERVGRDHVRTILQRAFSAVAPQAVMRDRIRYEARTLHVADVTLDLDTFATVRLVAVGKAAAGLAVQAEPWGPFADAVAVTPPDIRDLPGFDLFHGDHPVPTDRSVKAGERVLRAAEATGPDDLLIALISGGASAMVEVPAVPLEDLKRTTDLLLKSGAPIHEMNAVRKHLSHLKGGHLARAARGRVLVLYVSDVPGDDPAIVASGPFAPDASTFRDAHEVLAARGVLEALPSTVRQRIESGVKDGHMETPKPGDPVFDRVEHVLLASNMTAIDAAASCAAELGYRVEIVPGFLTGEARTAGHALAERARAAAPGTCIIAGGETTVRVIGAGRGGRNQESALAAVDVVSGTRVVFASVGTDGIDGPTDAAGAIVDGLTRARADAEGLDGHAHLAENDAYPYFEALDDLVKTGPTGTNVMDIAIAIHMGDAE